MNCELLLLSLYGENNSFSIKTARKHFFSLFFFSKIDEDALMVNVHSTAIQIIIIAQKTEKKKLQYTLTTFIQEGNTSYYRKKYKIHSQTE